jgi:hypothetical protein
VGKPEDDDEHPDPKLALIQAGVALALLIGLPIVLDPPTTPWGIAGLVVAAMLLMAFLVEGVMRFIRGRRRPFADSMLPPELERPAKKDKVDE